MSRHYLEVGIAFALLVLAALMGWGAALLPSGASTLPGPGFVPLALALLLVIAAIAHIAWSLLAEAEGDSGSERRVTGIDDGARRREEIEKS